MEKLIAYYRVSTKRQGESGLGLDAQRQAVQQYLQMYGGQVIAQHEEVESGSDDNRPKLATAIAQARRHKARIVIAKMDRLTRDVAFLFTLRKSGVKFVACDNPNASELTVGIMAMVAEDELKRISDRTKAALAAAKARGALLGSARPGHWDGREDARRRGAKRGNHVSAVVRREKAMEAVKDLLPEIRQRRARDESFQAIADALNAGGQVTSGGSRWSPMAVKRVLDRAA